MNVHILVSCRNQELWKFSTLVFDSIKVGFPTANIFIRANNLSKNKFYELYSLFLGKSSSIKIYNNSTEILHDEWIQNLIETETKPFWIVDTDVVFFDNMEKYQPCKPIAGIYIPEFCDPYTKYLTFNKLHTCVMYIDPIKVKGELNINRGIFFAPTINEPPISARRKLIRVNEWTYHHDTMSEVCHTVGGSKFTDEMKDCFGHINCGTYADLVDKKIPGYLARCNQLADNPELLRGSWKNDEEFYRLNPWPVGSGF